MIIYMSVLDLDPDSYTLNEISDFFSLNPNHTITQINDSFRNKHNEITLNKTMIQSDKDKMGSFFEELKNRLVLNLTQKPQDEVFTNYSDVVLNSFNRIDTIIPKNKILNNNASILINSENSHKKITNKLLSIDSIFRENYLTTKSTNFKLDIPSTIKNVKSINLVALELPLSYYNISENLGNNYLFIDQEKITLPDGKYTNAELIIELNLQLKLKYPIDSPFASYNSITKRTSISLVDKPELNFIKDKNGNEFTWNVNGGNLDRNIHVVDDCKGSAKLSNNKTAHLLNKRLGWLMGYRNGKYINGIADYSGSILPDDTKINFVNLSHVQVSNKQDVTLNWNVPTNTDYTYTGYHVFKGQYVIGKGIVYETPIFKNGVSQNFDGLAINETFYFKIQPLVEGESVKVAKAFETSFYTAKEGQNIPGNNQNEKVTRFRAYGEIVSGIPTIKLSWEFNVGNGFVGFIIEKSEDNHTWSNVETLTQQPLATSATHDISNIDQGIRYYFRIFRTVGGTADINKCAPFPDNTFMGLKKEHVCATVVGNENVSIPYELTFENLSNTSIKLKWSKPFLNAHLTTGYKISQSNDGFHYVVLEDDIRETEYTVMDLSRNFNYNFRINSVSNITCKTNLSIPVVIVINTFNNYAVSEGPLNTDVSFKYFYFILDDFNHNQDTNIIALKNNSIQSTKILARVPNICSNFNENMLMLGGDEVSDTSMTKKRIYHGPVDVKKIHIRITDEFGRDLELNNSDVSMGISFECIYD
jgi:hypothetical protein